MEKIQPLFNPERVTATEHSHTTVYLPKEN